MKRTLKKLLSLTCALALALSLLPSVFAAGPNVGGWFESIYAELPGVSKNQVTAVSWSGAMDGALTGEDLEYLVRNSGNGVRIDVLGLKAGTYTLKITVDGTDTIVSGVQVLEHDRSGYAHYNYTDGVGAYNDDGTLKAKAMVVYVTNENKDTVKLTVNGSTYTGIGNILGRKSGALAKMAAAGIPLVVRLVGDVKTPKGVTEKKMSTDKEQQNGDNGSMLQMNGGKNLTIEGVGADATVNGWGVSFACQASEYNQGTGKSFEVRNITFRNVPEDCINVEGTQEGDKLTGPVERIWIHNCSFYGPKIANPAAVDKAEGDGAVDFKRGQYLTMSYNYFEGYHKTNLVGGGDSNLQYNMTWHHNHWYKCESRGPLGRQANMHIYNCIYEGQTSYCMNTRANCYIFSEYNSFINSKHPMRVEKKDSGNGAGGPIKSFNDKFSGCSGDRQGTVVKEKTQTVASKNRYANFDTNPSLSYIPSGNYKLDDSNARAEEMVRAYAGPMKAPSAMVHPAGTVTAPTVDTAPATPAPSAPAAPASDPSPAPSAPVAEVTMPADVTEDDWFYPAVKTVLEKGAMKGTNLGFEPHTELTIASIYQTLYNMEGAKVTAFGPWYAPALTWASWQGLYSGNAAEFTDATALRGDVKTIMDAYCAKKGITATLFKGDQSGNLMLDKSLTRAEWAQVLANLEQGK